MKKAPCGALSFACVGGLRFAEDLAGDVGAQFGLRHVRFGLGDGELSPLRCLRLLQPLEARGLDFGGRLLGLRPNPSGAVSEQNNGGVAGEPGDREIHAPIAIQVAEGNAARADSRRCHTGTRAKVSRNVL